LRPAHGGPRPLEGQNGHISGGVHHVNTIVVLAAWPGEDSDRHGLAADEFEVAAEQVDAHFCADGQGLPSLSFSAAMVKPDW
jgi:hypothetical protein